MWRGDTIYFDSNQGPDHRMNLFAYSTKTQADPPAHPLHGFRRELAQPRHRIQSSSRTAASSISSISAHRASQESRPSICPAISTWRRKHWTNTSKLITSFDLSPDGKRATFSARGDVYTVPAKEGAIRNLTRTPGIREENVAWSPDGKWIAYLSDRTGEEEIYLTPQDGMGKEVRITTDGSMHRFQPVWSPDSKKLLYADKSNRLFYIDVDEKKPVQIDQGKYADLTDYNWSPDSKWAVYAKAAENSNRRNLSLLARRQKNLRRSPPISTAASIPSSIPTASISISSPLAISTKSSA